MVAVPALAGVPHPFQTYGALKAVARATASAGRLSSCHSERFRADRPDYVVYSYATPIAWHAQDGTWYVPDERYSQTTTRHQNVIGTCIQQIRLGALAPV